MSISISIADLNGTIANNIGSISLNSNQIWNLVDAKQDKLNASTIILGNGANITNINYNKVFIESGFNYIDFAELK